MQTMLVQRQDPNLRAYFIWGPYLAADNPEAAQSATRKYQAPNAAYYWTPSLRLGREFAGMLHLAGDGPAWDVYLLYPRGTQWEGRVPQPIYWQQQLDILQADVFDVDRMETHIQALIARK
ncbi:MAG TPA: hypothetical protein VE398_06425 [Acidobacteriota bacterium]|nr:hypothetical protein [Acidobacteriota bacterium]